MLENQSLDERLRAADPTSDVAKSATQPPSGLRDLTLALSQAAQDRHEREPGVEPGSRKPKTRHTKRTRRWWAAGIIAALTLCSGTAVVSARSVGLFGPQSSQDGELWCIQGHDMGSAEFVSLDPIKDCIGPRDPDRYTILSNGRSVAVVLKEELPANDGKSVTFGEDGILDGTWTFKTAAEVVPPVNKLEFLENMQIDAVTQPTECVTFDQHQSWVKDTAKRLDLTPPNTTRGIPRLSFWTHREWAALAWSEPRPGPQDCTYLTYSARSHTVFIRKLDEISPPFNGSPWMPKLRQEISTALKRDCLTLEETKKVVHKAKMAKGVDLDALDIHFMPTPHAKCTRFTEKTGGLIMLKFWGPIDSAGTPSSRP